MKIIEVLSKATGYMSVVAVFASVAIIIYEVFARYIFRWPTVWEIEASVFLIIFTTFVGSAFALKNNAHIKMDMIEERLGPGARRKLALVTSVLSFAFCVVASIKGWQMWWEAYSLGWKSDSVWAPPLTIPYLFLPVGFVLMSLQYIALIAKQIEQLRRGD
jgi:TRAP-type C4-dicarboxylate transport system permease small subunit